MKSVKMTVFSVMFVSVIALLRGQISQEQYIFKYAAAGGGEGYTVTIGLDNLVYAFGYNYNGQLGDGTTTPKNQRNPLPRLCSGIEAERVFAGTAAFAITASHTVKGWGRNLWGNVGDGTAIDRSVPVDLPILDGTDYIEAGAMFNLARKLDGSVFFWGSGHPGDGSDSTTVYTPIPVPGLNDVIDVSCGNSHAAVLRDNGTVYVWGRNYSGQLGIGSQSVIEKTPVQVSGLSGIVDIACGGDTTYALNNAGELYAWGANYTGQVGDGTTANRYLPVLVITGVSQVYTGPSAGHVIVRKLDGTLWGWGSNGYGQLSIPVSAGSSYLLPVNLNQNGFIDNPAFIQHIAVNGRSTIWINTSPNLFNSAGNNRYGERGF